ncbi:apolipoprotein L3 isoform X1 [Rattus norvegicus]|uniref:Apolipoprotein L7b like 1 n=1 Tax=Rattus norvegicus TaxID=10116 RepID=A0A0G2JW05_RAT|nr:apolipoprotein L3 isoform X1 [Rattus norvegicus]XP_006241997.1 apolipoprotein L3 isoform X1 [Rattus norvegicus]|eukprot:XP_006241996.1 PREDICTED: apolipoprotein L3 isoform X1 [Rattus norvegicus]
MGTPEKKCFLETVFFYLLDTRSLEDLQLLLTEEESWRHFVAGVGLSREEEDALREALAEIFEDSDGEEEDKLQSDPQDKKERGTVRCLGDESSCCEWESPTKEEDALREALGGNTADSDTEDEDQLQNDKERFLEAYPQVRLELEKHIKKLHALADKVDKVHRDCTVSQVVASSSSAVSGVLTILGLALAPVTAGVSLALSATGMGLGAAAAVTSVSTSIVEKVSLASAEAEASKLVPTKDTMNRMKEVLEQSGPRLASLSTNSIQNIQAIQKNMNAIQLAKANPHLATNAKRLMTTGKTSTQTTGQVQKAFGGTALAMTKEARIIGAATVGLFLLMDVVRLVEDSKHLHEGAKSVSAAELRRQARDLEQKLQELNQVHDSLTQ